MVRHTEVILLSGPKVKYRQNSCRVLKSETLMRQRPRAQLDGGPSSYASLVHDFFRDARQSSQSSMPSPVFADTCITTIPGRIA